MIADIETFVSHGADEVLVKPMDMIKLKAILAKRLLK